MCGLKWTGTIHARLQHQASAGCVLSGEQKQPLRQRLYTSTAGPLVYGQLCFAASRHLTSVLSCCRCLRARFTHNQLTIVIKRLSKQTWVWVAECCSMDTGTVFYTNTSSASLSAFAVHCPRLRESILSAGSFCAFPLSTSSEKTLAGNCLSVIRVH